MKKLWLLYTFCCLPLHRLNLSSGYGYRIHPLTHRRQFHGGIDLRARGDTAFAVLAGRITAAGSNPLLGVYVRLANGQFDFTYGHLSQIFVLPGDSVEAGAPLAVTGSTGRVTGEHLHFSVRFKNRSVDPVQFLRALSAHSK